MRALIFLAALVLLLALVGWVSFSRGPDRSSINLETQQIKHDTEQVRESGSEMLKKAGDAVEPKNETRHMSELPAHLSR